MTPFGHNTDCSWNVLFCLLFEHNEGGLLILFWLWYLRIPLLEYPLSFIMFRSFYNGWPILLIIALNNDIRSDIHFLCCDLPPRGAPAGRGSPPALRARGGALSAARGMVYWLVLITHAYHIFYSFDSIVSSAILCKMCVFRFIDDHP